MNFQFYAERKKKKEKDSETLPGFVVATGILYNAVVKVNISCDN